MSELPPGAPWGSITFVGVYWNCEERLEKLLAYVRPWFKKVIIGVQESPDGTLAVARKYANVVVEDVWHGRGDPTIQSVLDVARRGNPWVFLISDDEWPSEELLASLQGAVDAINKEKKDGAWVHFRSTIDGIDFTREQDEHLRLFRSSLTWPGSPHSRPNTNNTTKWRVGHVRHDRTLDEMMTDYVRRYDLTEKGGWGKTGIQEHNVRMIQGACNAIARHKGWGYVKAFPWWNEVAVIAYNGQEPVDDQVFEEQPEPVVEVKKSRSRKPTK
jgi:hypothetical protein